MKKTRILSIVLAAAMLCALLTGCMGGKTVLKINGNAISEDIFKSAIAQADSFYQQNYGFSMAEMLDQELAEGKTGADMLKEEAEGLVKEYESVRLFAKENGIELTAEDKQSIKDAKQSQIDSAGGRKAFIDSLTEGGVNETYFDYIIESQMIYQKLFTELFSGEGKYAPSAEMIADKLSTGYVRVKHVLVMAAEGDADYAEKKAKAEDIAKRAAAGEDFEALIKEFGEDPGMESNTEGYVFDKQGFTPSGASQMVTEFTEASFKLAENGVSGIVPSTHGFHIIKRYPLNKEYVLANYQSFSGELAMVAFSEEMTKYMETMTVERTAAFDEIDVHSVLGVEKALGAGVDVTEHSEDDGHDHSAEGEAADGEATDGGIEVGEAVPAQ